MIIFVFGSNEAGIHGAGAALDAFTYYGAVPGKGYGFGRSEYSSYTHRDDPTASILWFSSFAIPTKDKNIKTLPLFIIERYVKDFIHVAQMNPQDDFQVTRIGCGFAGYKDEEIAPMFQDAPSNVHLPIGWRI